MKNGDLLPAILATECCCSGTYVPVDMTSVHLPAITGEAVTDVAVIVVVQGKLLWVDVLSPKFITAVHNVDVVFQW